jgi:hypothetical protein
MGKEAPTNSVARDDSFLRNTCKGTRYGYAVYVPSRGASDCTGPSTLLQVRFLGGKRHARQIKLKNLCCDFFMWQGGFEPPPSQQVWEDLPTPHCRCSMESDTYCSDINATLWDQESTKNLKKDTYNSHQWDQGSITLEDKENRHPKDRGSRRRRSSPHK